MRLGWASTGLVVLLALLGACQSDATSMPASPVPTSVPSPESRITLGDVDPDEPTKKIKRFQPLAEYLAENLRDHGIVTGNVVIARDIEEMAAFLREGTVDLYFYSPYPALAVQELTGSTIIARRWKGGIESYWSTYIARRDSGIDTVEGFLGKVFAVEEPRSTSGFVLPVGTLIQRGFKLREMSATDAQVDMQDIGYVFSRDEENTVELVLDGAVAGGAISNEDYDDLSAETLEQIVRFDRTISVPRQVASIGPGLGPEIGDAVLALLLGLDQTEPGRELLAGIKDTKKFDLLPPDSLTSMDQLKELMQLVSPMS